ncbi:MAG: hypothetical protein LBO06_03210 [Bacteroidales bacterium]|jgi:hypothetical protein|nr:hypothetical protein [Bacteroidales bacterium]
MRTRIFKMLLAGCIIFAGLSAIVMLLWNALVVNAFGLAAIGFWQAAGWFILARIVFGGGLIGKIPMAMLARHGRGMRNNPLREKWSKMTPEQRKEVIDRHKECFRGFHGGFHGSFGFETEDKSKKDNE